MRARPAAFLTFSHPQASNPNLFRKLLYWSVLSPSTCGIFAAEATEIRQQILLLSFIPRNIYGASGKLPWLSEVGAGTVVMLRLFEKRSHSPFPHG
jgi:hypothetical protein